MARTPDRHTDAAFTEEEATLFHLGETVPLRSDHIKTARYDEAAERLFLTFKDGPTYVYPCDLATARGFAVAPSKGGALWDFFLRKGEKGSRI